MKNLVLFVISIYQKLHVLDNPISKMFFGDTICRFTPTCSEYTYESVKKYGIMKGLLLGSKRIARCNPLSKGGYDPVP
jgi:putative membrane protein insertion efficiency factor